jgi:HPt (histidine-containing phosphotransfer) domain-containing protein
LPIVALTANAVSGMKNIFLAGGFNDFLPKPIDTGALDDLLLKWIPVAKQLRTTDKSAVSGAATQIPRIAGVDAAAGMARVGGTPERYLELLQVFLRDARFRYSLLEANPDEANLPDLTTFVHALKTGLANIGAKALSQSAAALEKAGHGGDLDAIRERLPSFREKMAALMEGIKEAAAEATRPAAGRESALAAQLCKDLTALKAALKARDTDKMDSALVRLQNLPLTSQTLAAVADITQYVLFGDLKKAAAAVDDLYERVSPRP